MLTHKVVCGHSRQVWLDDTDEDEFCDDESMEDNYEGVSDPDDYDHLQCVIIYDIEEH